MDIFKNEKFKIFAKDNEIYLINNSASTTINEVNNILKNIPRVKLTEFSNLKEAIGSYDGDSKFKIGILKSKYEIIVSNDSMSAYYKINMSEKEFEETKPMVINNLNDALDKNNIKIGIIQKALDIEKISPNKKILIAKGIPPEKGEDSKIKYYELSKKKPSIDSKDKANHYELNLIDNVVKDEWVGEKTKPTIGKDGKNVYGDILPGSLGRELNLKYDRKTVTRVEEDDKYILIAKNNGAVIFKGNKIAVDDHLIINSDVDYETGNIDFDGHVTINGTVKDNFIVKATKNIAINTKIGIGAVKKIESLNGDIYIKGGISGKSISKIIAGNNIYAKYVKETTLRAENTINIGLYAIDSDIKAKNVILNDKKGRIIGGKLEATYKLESHSIGNKFEKQTKININGFNREELLIKLQTYKIEFNNLISKGNTLKRKLAIFEKNQSKLDEKGMNTYKALLISYDSLIDDINNLHSKMENISENLKTKGDGEVKIYDTAHPKTIIEIKNLQKILKKSLKQSLYAKDNKLHQY